jgi:2-polyprenyl-3-methyl-5-hydroxy-6-metoxy-1,4-benzoquinol methylase
MRNPWNHNIHYHSAVLRAVPADCQCALDVGCGQGMLASKLASRCWTLVAIDSDCDVIRSANQHNNAARNICFVTGDVMTYSFAPASFDMIAVVAALHHLPLDEAFQRFRDLLSPGGSLAAIGLYRMEGFRDLALAAIALPVSRLLRIIRGYDEVLAPIHDPAQTLREIRDAAARILPGAVVRQRLLFRYTLIWHKPN